MVCPRFSLKDEESLELELLELDVVAEEDSEVEDFSCFLLLALFFWRLSSEEELSLSLSLLSLLLLSAFLFVAWPFFPLSTLAEDSCDFFFDLGAGAGCVSESDEELLLFEEDEDDSFFTAVSPLVSPEGELSEASDVEPEEELELELELDSESDSDSELEFEVELDSSSESESESESELELDAVLSLLGARSFSVSFSSDLFLCAWFQLLSI